MPLTPALKTRLARFNVALASEPPWHVAKCLENGVTSQGGTREEAVANLKEALELFYEGQYVDSAFTEPPQTFLTSQCED